MWADRGHDVSVYSLWDKRRDDPISPSFQKYFTHYSVKFPLYIEAACLVFKGIFFFARKLISRISKGDDYAKIIKMSYFTLYCFLKSCKKEKTVLIGADPAGLCAAALASRRTGNPYVYFEREMFISKDTQNFIDRIIKYIERKANREALFTIEFDETRMEEIKRDNQLPRDRTMVIPNAPIGKARMTRGDYFNRTFGIENEKRIALYTSGISDPKLSVESQWMMPTFAIARDLIKSIVTWPNNVVLVMHCFGRKEQLEELINLSKRTNREIFFSTEKFPFETIDNIFSSSDIGFALYDGQYFNTKYTGLSSGKLFHFMKFCVPVITNNTPSCRKAIEETGSGVCIDEISEIGNAIKRILDKEEEFRLNCLNTFSRFSYDAHHTRLMDAVENHMEIER